MSLARIFAIFLYMTLTLTAIPELYAEISLIPRNAIDHDYSGGKDIEFLRLALRRINRLARRCGIERQNRKVLFRIKSRSWQIYSDKQNQIVMVPGTSSEWEKDFELRRKLFGIMFRSRFNLPVTRENDPEPLPVWIAAGMDDIMRTKSASGKYLSTNKDFSALRSMMKLYGKLPDFSCLPEFTGLPSDTASRLLFHQMSHLLLELTAEKKLLLPIIRDHHNRLPANRWLSVYSSPIEAKLQLADAAEKQLWSQRNPRAAELLLKQLPELRIIIIPELDNNGAPTGKMMEVSFAQAHSLLRNTKRPDHAELRRYCAIRIISQFHYASPEVRKIASELAKAANQLGESRNAANEFDAVYSQLKARLEYEKLRETVFLQHCFRSLAAHESYFHFFSLFSIPENTRAGSLQVEEFLKRTEREYLKNY